MLSKYTVKGKVYGPEWKYTVVDLNEDGLSTETKWSLYWNYTVCECLRSSKLQRIRSPNWMYMVFLLKLNGLCIAVIRSARVNDWLWMYTVPIIWKQSVLNSDKYRTGYLVGPFDWPFRSVNFTNLSRIRASRTAYMSPMICESILLGPTRSKLPGLFVLVRFSEQAGTHFQKLVKN